jgi:hypothetical protein
MKNPARILALGLGLIGLFGAAPAVAGRARATAPVADVIAGAARLDFVPRQGGDGFVLTVSGPDGFIEQTQFDAGRAVMFTSGGPGGVARRDGIYTFELRVRRAAPALSFDSLSGAESPDGRAVEIETAVRGEPSGDSLVQTGTFWIQNGLIISEGAIEPRARRSPVAGSAPASGKTAFSSLSPLDQVIVDDLIVQGSACIGLDCVNNESFSFDTIRLKENNTRIAFNDTSVGTFATNDWTIRANSSSSGGASFLAFVDRGASSPGDETGTIVFEVDAGAPANSLKIDSSGRAGFRTATPVLDIHTNTGNTPALRLEQNSSGGFTAQTWDIAGNEANFFVRDVTGGSRLPLRIRPGAPTSSIDINASGMVGVGTASPLGKLDVRGEIATRNLGTGLTNVLSYTGNGGVVGTLSNHSLMLWTNSTEKMRILPNGNVGIGVASPGFPIEMASGANVTVGGVWTNASSREYKLNIRELSSEAAEETLAQLNPVTYAYKAAPAEHHIGFIAEDVPEIVATLDRKGLSPMDIVGVLTKVVQEQQKTIKELSERLARIEAAGKVPSDLLP